MMKKTFYLLATLLLLVVFTFLSSPFVWGANAAPQHIRERIAIDAIQDSFINGASIIWYSDGGRRRTTQTAKIDKNGNADFEGTLDVTGNTTLTGSLTVTGTFASNGALAVGRQAETVTATFIITPTDGYIVLSSSLAVTSSTTTPIITSTATPGQVASIRNGNASDVITLDGTGGTLECGADVALDTKDVVEVIYDDTDAVWYCTGFRDNSP